MNQESAYRGKNKRYTSRILNVSHTSVRCGTPDYKKIARLKARFTCRGTSRHGTFARFLSLVSLSFVTSRGFKALLCQYISFIFYPQFPFYVIFLITTFFLWFLFFSFSLSICLIIVFMMIFFSHWFTYANFVLDSDVCYLAVIIASSHCLSYSIVRLVCKTRSRHKHTYIERKILRSLFVRCKIYLVRTNFRFRKINLFLRNKLYTSLINI